VAEYREKIVEKKSPVILKRRLSFLSLSGGGHNGAFGAGLLNGWSEAGTRPEFFVVTGISTGAVIAPFAFLGPDFDHVVENIYTRYKTEDALRFRSLLNSLLGDSAADVSGMKDLIKKYIDQPVVDAIAREYRKGRMLFIGTTNLDAGRPVIWNIGKIAASRAPGTQALVEDIILASASIPGVFPPVLIAYEAPDGKRYEEMHVDGGVTRQVFLFPAAVEWQEMAAEIGFTGEQDLYIIYNGQQRHRREVVAAELLPIASRSVSTLIKTQGVGDLYRLYLISQQNKIDYNLAMIPPDFDEEPAELFDREYMRKLFDLGRRIGKKGDPWQDLPPEMDSYSGTPGAENSK
jgi:predicted acylesterase/phospholipase RssA